MVRTPAHSDDVNAVAYADDSCQTIFTGSDDAEVRVWDRRLLGSASLCVGVFLGHTEGVTHLDAKGDGRYVISNSKDQTVKVRARGGRVSGGRVSGGGGGFRDFVFWMGASSFSAYIVFRHHACLLSRAQLCPPATHPTRLPYALPSPPLRPPLIAAVGRAHHAPPEGRLLPLPPLGALFPVGLPLDGLPGCRQGGGAPPRRGPGHLQGPQRAQHADQGLLVAPAHHWAEVHIHRERLGGGGHIR